MDNIEAPAADNSNAQAATGTATQTPATTTDAASVASNFSWKSNVSTELRNSPLMQKFDDNVDGLNKAIESHANLEKLLGHEKVPIPKGADDVEGWNRFSKALGIPDKAEGYGLPDAQIPEEMKALSFDKNKFAEVVHAHKLTPAQAKGLWETYVNMSKESYANVMKQREASVTETINKLKGEWGDAFDSNVELGQMVINKFAADQESNDFITSTLAGDPRGVKFLAKIGSQFAENKIGEFTATRFNPAPEQAMEEIQKIIRDPNHPYNNERATEKEHQAAVDYVNSLYASVNRARG